MDDLKKRLRQRVKSGSPSWMDVLVNPAGDEAAARIEALEARVAAADKLAEACISVDGYLTHLQTPGTEPLNSVNSSTNRKDRNYFTAQVRNEARKQWAALGNALAAYEATKEGE